MTGEQIIDEARQQFEDYDRVELVARGSTYASREQLKYLGFGYDSRDKEWMIALTRVGERVLVSGAATINADELDALVRSGVEFHFPA